MNCPISFTAALPPCLCSLLIKIFIHTYMWISSKPNYRACLLSHNTPLADYALDQLGK